MNGRPSINRKTAMKVKGGRVQRKNRHVPTTRQGYVIDRESPRKGFRHVVTKAHLVRFLELIPDWPLVSVGLERVVLGGGEDGTDGCYEYFHRERTGSIRLEAWSTEDRVELQRDYYEAHRTLFDRFSVTSLQEERARVTAYFSEVQARAFLLLHVFMHELGHHRERMLRKESGIQLRESFAESFANQRFEELWERYNTKLERVR